MKQFCHFYQIFFLEKTRTKDKYRVVYNELQRNELEKEFNFSKYITSRRKTELAGTLDLSQRQIKIWFQNRRAKDRKINKQKRRSTVSSNSSFDSLNKQPFLQPIERLTLTNTTQSEYVQQIYSSNWQNENAFYSSKPINNITGSSNRLNYDNNNDNFSFFDVNSSYRFNT